MKIIQTSHGSHRIAHRLYAASWEAPIIQESGDCLCVGQDHRLNRDEIRELIGHMTRWAETGSLGSEVKP